MDAVSTPNLESVARCLTDNAYIAKQLGEHMYGVGNVLNYTEVSS